MYERINELVDVDMGNTVYYHVGSNEIEYKIRRMDNRDDLFEPDFGPAWIVLNCQNDTPVAYIWPDSEDNPTKFDLLVQLYDHGNYYQPPEWYEEKIFESETLDETGFLSCLDELINYIIKERNSGY